MQWGDLPRAHIPLEVCFLGRVGSSEHAIMKTTLTTALRSVLIIASLSFAVTTVSAVDKKEPKAPSPAEIKKYDADKNGTLDETELAAMKAAKKATADAKKATAEAKKAKEAAPAAPKTE
jgi:hypothetical protein